MGYEFVTLKKAEHLFALAIPAALIQSIWVLLNEPVSPLLRSYQISHPLLGVAVAFMTGLDLDLALLQWWPLWLLPGLLFVGWELKKRVLQGDEEAKKLVFGGAFLAICVIHDTFWGQIFAPFSNWSALGLALFGLSMAGALANRFERCHRELGAAVGDLQLQIEQGIRETARERQRAATAIGTKKLLLSQVSQQLRAPADDILALTSRLLKSKDGLEMRQPLQLLENVAHRLLRLLDDILDLARLDAGTLKLERRVFRLDKLLRGALLLLEQRLNSGPQTVRFQFSKVLPKWVRGDPSRLRQVFQNLLSHAMKQGHKGMTVIRVEAADHGLIRFRFLGVPPGLWIQSFPSLSSATAKPNSTRTRQGNSVLAMTISMRLIHLMDGQIGLDTESEVGSNFWFVVSLPRAISGEIRRENGGSEDLPVASPL